LKRRQLPGYPKLYPYYSRKHDHVLRLAGAIRMAKGGQMTFTVEDLEAALALVDRFEEDVHKVYSRMALSPWAAAQAQIMRVLEENKGQMQHSALHKRMYRQLPLAAQFTAAIESLLHMGVIREGTGLSGRGKVYTMVEDLEV
jgi:hypothetical protein